MIDHRRRCALTGREWRSVGLYGWLQAEGTIRGLIALGDLSLGEVETGLSRRWPTSFPQIESTTLRIEVFWSLHPIRIWSGGPAQGRYQGVKIAIWPVRPAAIVPSAAQNDLSPMPMLLP
jgi:hypothetical protein